MDDIYKLLGKRVRAERKLADLTLDELGEKAGITGAFVSHIEAGRKGATLATVAKLARALDIPLSELLEPRNQANSPDQRFLKRFSHLIRDKTPRQKYRLLNLVKTASTLIK